VCLGRNDLLIRTFLKAYDDDVLKNLLNGWFMHIAIHAKNLKELADKKGQFIAIYRGFLLSLKDK
ncbi:TPA: hypothetical protein N6W48_004993, partial [Escherichia coli]|nr:hypothetical protein [Escherichia coli]HCN7547268.1 hypothetical protein [Escherichia coli]